MLLLLLMSGVAAASNITEEEDELSRAENLIDFKTEVENFIASKEEPITFNNSLSFSNHSLLVLDPGVLAERDYDFYEDDLIDPDLYEDVPIEPSDSDTAGSSVVNVRAGLYPQHADRRNLGDYDYEYEEAEERDYGHSSDHGGSYGGSHDSGYKVEPKKPGPYGYATSNFKCEKSSETLYVTETEMTYDKKCYNVYKVKCTEGYDEGKV